MLLINDLRRHNQELADELKKSVLSVLESGWYVLGEQVRGFEQEFAAYCQATHCVSVANGTEALELSLRALGVGAGDVVATVANAGGYSTTAIRATGATPHYVEIESDTLLLSVEHLRNLAGTARIGAIIVTHLYGRMARMDEVLAVAEEAGVPVIEDCAQAHGAVQDGRRAGSFGVMGCFSFYPTKNLGALGDGGAVTTNDAALAARLQRLRQYGWTSKYEMSLPGGRNSRLDELQAGILRAKLPHLDAWNRRRREICRLYSEGISHPAVKVPAFGGEEHVGHLYVLRAAARGDLQAHLKARGIMSDIHYPIPDYLQPAFRGLHGGLSLPVTEQACGEVLTLPCFPEMVDAEVREVIDAVNGWQAACAR